MRTKVILSGFVLAALASTTLNAAMVRMASRPENAPDLAPTGKGWGEARPDAPERWTKFNHKGGGGSGGGGGGGQYGIYFHGGPLMTGTIAVYYIYYGTWSASQKTIFEDFGSTIGGSPYFNINTTYWGANNTAVVNSVRLGGSTADNYSQGSTLSDGQIFTIVQTAINNGSLPKDSNGVYFVITSADVDKTGFCTSYCGWHSDGPIGGTDIKYAFIGDSDRCPANCSGQQGNSPNGDTGVDGAINVLGHELEESATDPDGNAWFDNIGRENADKCAWNFGQTYTAPNGSAANMHLGSRDYLIQQNWTNALINGLNAGCQLKW